MPGSKEQRAATAMLLRQQAELQARQETEDFSLRSPEEIKALIHELHVHEIELEMQNEQLRESQSELELARERMAELYDFAPVGYLTLNEGGVIRQANLTLVTMLGAERTRLLAQKLSNFVISSDQDQYYLCLRRVFNSSGNQVCELRFQPAVGAVFIGRMEAVGALERGERVCRMTLSDITPQKRAEERWREAERNQARYESEEWKRLAFEASGLGALDQDLANGKVTWSGEACKMFGCEMAVSPTWEDLVERIHPGDRPGFLSAIESATSSDGRVDTVFRVLVPGEQVRWIRMLARTSFGVHRGRTRALRRTGVLADITQMKRAEETLRTHAEQLKAMVRERTSRLEDAVAELEHLSYTLVHDLRAPLRAITGYTSLLLEQCTDLQSTHQAFLRRSNQAAVRMDNLIMDALSYTRLTRDHSTLGPVDALALLRQLLESYPQFQEAAKYIKIENSWPPVIGNSALLTQCFSNLLTNGLKFVAPGEKPSVRVYADDRGKRARIWFEDKGIGIDGDGKRKLFRMFQRLQTSYEGTGIGLALVKKAVERMNGTVGVESQVGKGSRFWIELEKPGASGGGQQA